MHARAIAFDFDGTLIRSGDDKCVHILYAAYFACHATGFRRCLRLDEPAEDVEILLRGLVPYPGAPRFQQLSALMNSLLNGRPVAVDAPAGLLLEPGLAAEYDGMRRLYDKTYTALNDAAAAKYWRAFPAALWTIPQLVREFDLYVASGVPQALLEVDLVRHGYSPDHFQAIWGADVEGGRDKAELLAQVRGRGYREVLFVGDATRDLEYARAAGVKFFRVKADEDFASLARAVCGREFPDHTQPWAWNELDLAFFRSKALRLVEALLAGRPFSPGAAVDAIHA